MSANVDQRIVQMQFDNAQFEQKAQNTITTLNSLNEALKMPQGSSGMEKVQSTAQKIDFSKLNQAIELVNYRFSNLGMIATNIFNRISNAAINTGHKMVNALTMEPIKAGFSEYELKMDSVKRILNSAKDDQGLPVTLDVVNKKLDELNRYSDKTIYSFADMTQNIGKFTNAGVSLDNSVSAIKGIANEAALSGANAQEASRAMYNFAQALSAGYVKLIDWKSIENANMATVSFKDELLKTALAVGTIVEKDGQYITTTTDLNGKVSQAFDSTHAFNESLSHQWMTSEVLTKTLAKYADETTEIGKAAMQAATEVMTFSKLIDTLKEAMQSGWAQTWQIIIGDYGEAKELWTSINNVLSDMINRSAESRNNLVAGWEVLGGRKAVLEGLKDIWGGLVNIVNEFSWAFSSVIDEVSAVDLFHMSTDLRDVAKAFREFTGRHGADFNGIARGIASAFDLLLQTFSAVKRTIKPLLQPLGELFGIILHNSGLAGRNFSEFVKGLRDNDTIYKGLQSLVSALQKVYDYAGRAVSAFLKLFGIETGFDSSINPLQALVNVISSFGENPHVKNAAAVIDSVRDSITTFISSIKNTVTLQNVSDGLKGIGGALATVGKYLGGGLLFVLKTAGQLLGDLFGSFKDARLDNLVNIFNAGSVATVIMGIKTMLTGLKAPSDGIKGIFDFLKGLGTIGDKVGKSLSDFAKTITGPFKTLQESLKADILIKIAKAIAILVGSIFVLSTIDPGRMGVALLGISALMGELTGVVTAISKFTTSADAKKFSKLGGTMVAFGIAIGLLALSTKALSKIDPTSLRNGVLAVGTLMVLAGLMTKFGGKNFKAKGLLTMAAAIFVLQFAVKRLGELDSASLKNGMLAVGALMVLMTLMSRFGGKNFNGKGMLSMSAAIFVMQEAIKRLGELDQTSLVKGTVAVGALMVLMTLMSRFGGKNFSGTSILMMAGAMVILEKVIESLSAMDADTLGTTLLSMAFALGTVAAALNAMKGTIGGAVAFTLVAVSLNLLVPVIQKLSSMPLDKMLKGIAGLALALGVLIAAGYGAQAVVVPLLALGGAMTLIGIGVAALGAGLVFASAGLTAFSASLVANSASVIASIGIIITGVIGLIPTILTAVVDGILQIVKLIGNSAQTIVGAVVQIGVAIIDGLRQILVPLGTFILEALTFILQLLTEYSPILAEALIELVVGFIDGVALAIYNNTDRIIGAVHHVVGAVIDFVLATLQELLKDLPGVGGKIESEIGKLRESVQASMNTEEGKKVGSDYASGVANGVEGKSSEIELAGGRLATNTVEATKVPFSELPAELQEKIKSGFVDGASGAEPDAEAAGISLGNIFTQSVGEATEFKTRDTGANAVEGFANGITENSAIAKDAASIFGTETLGELNSSLQVESPSRATWQTGMYLDQGLANGITENQSIVGTAISGIGSAIAGVFGSLASRFSAVGRSAGLSYSSGLSSSSGSAATAGRTVAATAGYGMSSKISSFGQNGTHAGSQYTSGIASKAGVARTAGALVSSSAIRGLESSKRSALVAGTSSGSNYTTGLSSKRGLAKTTGASLGTSAVSGMKSVSGFWDAGRDSSEGYINGMLSKAREIANTAANIVRNALSAAKSAIDSNSPSKKYMKLGEDSGEGYIIGAKNKSGEMDDTMARIALGSMGAFYDGISRANALATDENLFTPTVAPVMDLNSVYDDMNYLNGMFRGTGGVLGSITTDIDSNVTDINKLVTTTNKILTVLGSARQITIDGNTVIGWVDRGLGALG